MDEETKRKAQELFTDLGMDLSTAVNIFLRQAIRENAIPFKISRAAPNSVTLAAMDSAENGMDVTGPFNGADELVKALNADR